MKRVLTEWFYISIPDEVNFAVIPVHKDFHAYKNISQHTLKKLD